MRKSTTWQRSWGKWLTLPLLLLGFLLVPFGLLPAHGVPGHSAAMISTSTSAHIHETQHDADSSRPSTLHPAAVTHAENGPATSHDERDHGAPFCDAGPDYSTIAPGRPFPDSAVDLVFLFLAAAFGGLAAGDTALRATWATLLRRWTSRPHWRPFGATFLSQVSISRT